MATGVTTTGSLADSLDVVVASARLTNEQEGGMSQLVTRESLDKGTGLDWKEVTYAKLTAAAVTETSENENYQQLSDTVLTITPTMVQIVTALTKRLEARMTNKGWRKLGVLAQQGMTRKMDTDGVAVLDAAGTTLAGTGVTLTSGHIAAAVSRIRGNVTEPAHGPIHAVIHPYQTYDLQAELLGALGTYPIADGETAKVYREGFKGKISGAYIFEDGNITPDSVPDAKGGVFPKEGIVLVQGTGPRSDTEWKPRLGGGTTLITLTNEYAYGERKSSIPWLFGIKSDATVPSS